MNHGSRVTLPGTLKTEKAHNKRGGKSKSDENMNRREGKKAWMERKSKGRQEEGEGRGDSFAISHPPTKLLPVGSRLS